MEERPKTIHFKEDYDEIIHPDYRDALNEDSVKDDNTESPAQPEEFAETGAVIVYLFCSLLLFFVIALAVYFMNV